MSIHYYLNPWLLYIYRLTCDWLDYFMLCPLGCLWVHKEVSWFVYMLTRHLMLYLNMHILDISAAILVLQNLDHLWNPCLVDIFVSLYLWQYLLKLCTHAYIQMTNAHEVLSWMCQIFYICKPYLFLHIHDPFSILSFAVIFVFCKCLLSFSHNSQTFHIKESYVFLM